MHPDIDNRTSFSIATLPGHDESGKSIVTVIVKATLGLANDGRIVRVDKGDEIDFAGEPMGTDDAPFFRYEPETAFVKLATDVVLIGHAVSPQPGLAKFDVGFRCGPVAQLAQIFGDRYWVQHRGAVVATTPKAVDRLPLSYEHAFGGWDRSDADPAKHSYDPRNPAGVGFGMQVKQADDRQRLPNIENPQGLIREYGQRVQPIGFGFVAPNWEPRASFAGTYDAAWDATRKPLLPQDFDRRFFNAAPVGLIAQGFLRGDEQIDIVNASPVPRLSFRLPGFPTPTCEISLHAHRKVEVALQLDTIVVDTDAMKVMQLWRGCAETGASRRGIAAVSLDCNHPAAKRRAVTG